MCDATSFGQLSAEVPPRTGGQCPAKVPRFGHKLPPNRQIPNNRGLPIYGRPAITHQPESIPESRLPTRESKERTWMWPSSQARADQQGVRHAAGIGQVVANVWQVARFNKIGLQLRHGPEPESGQCYQVRQVHARNAHEQRGCETGAGPLGRVRPQSRGQAREAKGEREVCGEACNRLRHEAPLRQQYRAHGRDAVVHVVLDILQPADSSFAQQEDGRAGKAADQRSQSTSHDPIRCTKA
mmetsp:Transcript_84865/g.274318  ORF Transcript_84865/g.274318 Transcript_84865/m.274318 type:complete len:241 (-) Transcript_84865:137-859(-)